MQTLTSPIDTKSNDSHLELSIDNNQLNEFEQEIRQLRDVTEHLQQENSSLRTILKDYEEIRNNEETLLERVNALTSREKNLLAHIDHLERVSDASQSRFERLKDQLQQIKKANLKLETSADLKSTHQDTKIRLLTEALNNRNEDIKLIEESNEELIELLEKWDNKLIKLDEDYRLEKIKAEKYQRMLHKQDPSFNEIDIATINGRIGFMVNTLEEYKKILEDTSQPTSDACKCFNLNIYSPRGSELWKRVQEWVISATV